MNSCVSGEQFIQTTSLAAPCNSQQPSHPAKEQSVCPDSALSKMSSLQVEIKAATVVLKNHMLFSAPSTKVRTGIYLLINKSPALCFDTKLPKKTQGESVSNTVLSPLRLLTSKPKTLIKDCSSDTHLEVNRHVLIIVIAD